MTVVFFVITLVFLINAHGTESFPNYQRQYGFRGEYTTTPPFRQTPNTQPVQHSVIVDEMVPNGYNRQNTLVISPGTRIEQHVTSGQSYGGVPQREASINNYNPDDCDDGVSITINRDGSRVYDVGNSGSNDNVVVLGDKVYRNNEPRTTPTRNYENVNYGRQDKRNINRDDRATTVPVQARPGDNGHRQGSQSPVANDAVIPLNKANGGIITTGPDGEPRRTETSDFARGNNRNIYGERGTVTPQNTDGVLHSVNEDRNIPYQNSNSNTKYTGYGYNRQNNAKKGTSDEQSKINAQTHNDNPQRETSTDDTKPEDCDEGPSVNIGNGRSNDNVVVIGQDVFTNNGPISKPTGGTNYARQDNRYGNGDGQTRGEGYPDPNSNGYTINIGNGQNRRNNVVISEGRNGEPTVVHAETSNIYPKGYPQGNNDYIPNNDGFSTGPDGTRTFNIGNGENNENTGAIGLNGNRRYDLRSNSRGTPPNRNDEDILVGRGKNNKNTVYSA